MFDTLINFNNEKFKDTGKILVSYSPNGLFPLDTNSELFYSFVIEQKEIDLIRRPGQTIDGEWIFLPYGNYIWEGEISSDGKLLRIMGEYSKTSLFRLEDGLEKYIYHENGKIKCGYCDNMAKYTSMEGVSGFLYKDYFCRDCAPKSDSVDNVYKEQINLNRKYLSTDGVFLKGNILENYILSMEESDYLISLDENGKEYPSSLMFYEEEGFTKED